MISVIIPLYNVEKYIHFCLQSFENQIEREFEIIVINDGSTDRSCEIVESFISKSNLNIKLIHQDNNGVSSARNRGILESSGDYICFVDSDDLVTPNYLSLMKNMIDKNNSDLAFCGTITVDEDFTLEEKGVALGTTTYIMSSHEALNKYLNFEFVTGVWSLMIKKEIMDINKLKFSEGYRYSEDLEMVWKMIASSNIVVLTNEPLYIYRIRKGSAMNFLDDSRIDGLRLMEGLECYFQQKKPDFYEKFKKHGVARWVWSTTWQAAVASSNYSSFKSFTRKINSKNCMNKLLAYPQFKVKYGALLYLLSPFLFFIIAKDQGSKRLRREY